MFVSYLIFYFAIFNVCYTSDECRTDTIYGEVSGIINESRNHSLFCSFLGIPYAKPPIGVYRFAQSVEIDRWYGVFDAKKDGNVCIQKNYLLRGHPVYGSEDCLYLNVHTKKNFKNQLLPVMVYIHGGGFFAGSGSSYENGPEYFMDEDIVLVTINYRLAVFGFLVNNKGEGNWGLKDQVLALKWVQKNIEFFGGNKNQVTIFGQSAGGASVHHHILSNRSVGLFHRAISQSGVATALWAKTTSKKDANLVKIYQAQFVNCTIKPKSAMWACLKNTSALKLLESTIKFKIWDIEPYNTFLPSIERHFEEAFIDRDVFDVLKNGPIPNKVPWIVGNVMNEGSIRISGIATNNTLIEFIKNNFDDFVPKYLYGFNNGIGNSNITDIWSQIKEHYDFDNSIDNIDTLNNYSQAYGDRFFVYPVYQAVYLHHKQHHSNIYLYKFTYKNGESISYATLFANDNSSFFESEAFKDVMGVSHCDDLLYLFYSKEFFPNWTKPVDIMISRKMVSQWTNFASNVSVFDWKPIEESRSRLPDAFDYFHFDSNEFRMKRNYFIRRMKFWKRLNISENN